MASGSVFCPDFYEIASNPDLQLNGDARAITGSGNTDGSVQSGGEVLRLVGVPAGCQGGECCTNGIDVLIQVRMQIMQVDCKNT